MQPKKIIRYHVYKSSPPVSNLRQKNQIHTLIQLSLRSVLILVSHIPLGLLSRLYPSDLPTKILHVFTNCPIRVTRLADLVVLHLVKECLELYLHSPIRLHGMVLS
jgi:hypothetical protein